MSLTITAVKDRETKNTIRYQEEGSELKVGVLYIQKGSMDPMPDKVQVTIEAVE